MPPDSPLPPANPASSAGPEKRFSELFELAPFSIQILAPDGRTLRVTRGLIQLDRTVLDPMAIVAGAVEQARPLVEARRHVLCVDGDAGGARIVGDANRLVQALVNLLNNAAKYTPPGGSIDLSVARQGTTLSIRVRDNGLGIDAALLPHVFDLFTQAERSPDRAQGGLGIGLALVKTIVTLHGGQVVASSDGPGAGSEFTVTLPCVVQ
ncbi:sensor histidine kinase [Massilia sp. TN1-12]|uniref:sensor histidine kinase n=1 Tax=Massilia paldalensis TaxID=3377675 RepID=UPI00384A90A2